jgi:hypothetical protein
MVGGIVSWWEGGGEIGEGIRLGEGQGIAFCIGLSNVTSQVGEGGWVDGGARGGGSSVVLMSCCCPVFCPWDGVCGMCWCVVWRFRWGGTEQSRPRTPSLPPSLEASHSIITSACFVSGSLGEFPRAWRRAR